MCPCVRVRINSVNSETAKMNLQIKYSNSLNKFASGLFKWRSEFIQKINFRCQPIWNWVIEIHCILPSQYCQGWLWMKNLCFQRVWALISSQTGEGGAEWKLYLRSRERKRKTVKQWRREKREKEKGREREKSVQLLPSGQLNTWDIFLLEEFKWVMCGCLCVSNVVWVCSRVIWAGVLSVILPNWTHRIVSINGCFDLTNGAPSCKKIQLLA